MTDLATYHDALRRSASSGSELDAVNLLIVAGWSDHAGFRTRCIVLEPGGRAHVNWTHAFDFLGGLGAPRDEHRVPCPSILRGLLFRANALARGNVELITEHFARIVTGDGTATVLLSDGQRLHASTEALARELVPAGYRLIDDEPHASQT